MSNLPFFVRAIPIIRWVFFGLILIFSLVVLGANGNYIYTELNTNLSAGRTQIWPQKTADAFSVLGLIVAIFSIISIIPMIIVDIFRRGAFTSMVVTELCWLGFLMVMWIAQAAYTSTIYVPLKPVCDKNQDIDNLADACLDVVLAVAFGWLNWIMLITYHVLLLTLAIIASKQGKAVWKMSVRGNDFGYGDNKPSVNYKGSVTESTESFSMRKMELSDVASEINAPVATPAPTGFGYGSAGSV